MFLWRGWINLWRGRMICWMIWWRSWLKMGLLVGDLFLGGGFFLLGLLLGLGFWCFIMIHGLAFSTVPSSLEVQCDVHWGFLWSRVVFGSGRCGWYGFLGCWIWWCWGSLLHWCCWGDPLGHWRRRWWSLGFGWGAFFRCQGLQHLFLLFLPPSPSDLHPFIAVLFWGRIGGFSDFGGGVFGSVSSSNGIGGVVGVVVFSLPRLLHLQLFFEGRLWWDGQPAYNSSNAAIYPPPPPPPPPSFVDPRNIMCPVWPGSLPYPGTAGTCNLHGLSWD